MSATTPARRRLAAFATVSALAVMATAAGAATEAPAPEPDPIDVLVYSKAHAFEHTESIVASIPWFTGLNADPEQWHVVNTVDAADLRAANLANYDVLVWNNSTGSVPLTM